jgi:ABC-type bacteriocin/lantibiotic exporter with double-glycine peptidase domain
LFFFAIMCLYSTGLSLLVLGLSFANLAVLLVISRLATEAYRKLSIQQGKLSGVGLSGLQDIETYKSSGTEDLFLSRWTGLHAGIVTTQQALGARLAALEIAPALVATLTTAAILVLGGREVMNGNMTIGGLVAFQTLAASFTAPLATLMGLAASLQEVRSFTERIDDVLMQAPEPGTEDADAGQGHDELPAGGLALDAASFGYLPLEAPLIAGLSLEAKPGARIALVGASGSGKSTVGRLLVGLFAPTQGQALLDARPLMNWPRASRAVSLSYVDQNIVLFEGTVRENLTLWDATVPDHDIIAAARDAMIHDVIAERPGGYSAMVEEGGRNFSGGQRQRLEIARALVTNPKVLVLDEATSALDTISESEIMDNIKRRGCTLIVIAHRLSTIRDSDEIIVFERGQVRERGGHRDLMSSRGIYAQLIEA